MSQYFGKFDEGNNEVFDLIKTSQSVNELPCLMMFWSKYHSYPRTMESPASGSSTLYLSYSLLLKLLKEKYNHVVDNDIIKYIYDPLRDNAHISSMVLELTDGVIVHFMNGSLSSGFDDSYEADLVINEQELFQFFTRFKVYFMPGKEDFVKEFFKLFKYLKLKKRVPEPLLQMICQNECEGLYLTPIKIKKRWKSSP